MIDGIVLIGVIVVIQVNYMHHDESYSVVEDEYVVHVNMSEMRL